MNLADIPSPVFKLLPMAEPKVRIGEAWRPGHRTVRDELRGFYCEINPPAETLVELRLQAIASRGAEATAKERLRQRAMLLPTRPTVGERIARAIRRLLGRAK